MKTCEEMTELMSLYIDNELSLEELKDFEKHLNNCHSCKKELKNLKEVVLTLNNLKEVELPESYHEELVSKLNKVKNNKFKYYKNYALVSCMFLIFISLFLFNDNISNNNEDFSGFSANTIDTDLDLDNNMARSFKGPILENDIGMSVQEPLSNIDFNTPFMENFISYNIHLEVEDIEEAYHIINDFPGDMVFSNFDDTYGTIYYEKVVDINDYGNIKNVLESLGNTLFEEENGFIDEIPNLTEHENNEIFVNIYITIQEIN